MPRPNIRVGFIPGGSTDSVSGPNYGNGNGDYPDALEDEDDSDN